MKKTILLGWTVFLASTTAAYSAPLGSLIITAALSIGAGSLLPVASAAAIGWAAAGLALTAINIAFQFMGRRHSANPDAIRQTRQGQEGPGRNATGRVKAEAVIAYGNTAGYDIHRLGLHAFGPMDAIEEYLYDDRVITVDSDGAVSSPPWGRPGGTNMYVRHRQGLGNEAAWPGLVSAFPIWTTDHRARGIAQYHMRAINPGQGNEAAQKRFTRLFQGGIKDLGVIARFQRPFDPRTSANAWTLNGVLQTLHWFRQLPGVTDDLIAFDKIGDVATQAEASVPTLGGTAPRCQMSGGWEGPLTYDIVLDMLESCGLDLREDADDKYFLEFIEDNPASELDIPYEVILDWDYQATDEAAQRPNVCRVRYFSPERQYSFSEIPIHQFDGSGNYTGPAWARVQSEIDKYGEHEFPVDLPFCCNASQAQRIARRLFHMARAETGIIRLRGFAGMAAFGKRTITFEIPDVGAEEGDLVQIKARKGTVRVNFREGFCDIPFQVIPDILKTPWNPATDEVPPPPVLELQQFESELDKPAMPAEATVVQYPGGAFETRMRFAGVTGGTIAEGNYRTYTGGEPNPWQAMTEWQSQVSSGTWYARATADAKPRADFRVRFFNSDEEGSYFSDVLEADPLAISNATPAAPTVSNADFIDDGYGTVLTNRFTQLRAVRLLTEYNINNAGWVTANNNQAALPGTLYTVQIGGFSQDTLARTVQWRVSVFTSDGTQSAYTTGSFVIPAVSA